MLRAARSAPSTFIAELKRSAKIMKTKSQLFEEVAWLRRPLAAVCAELRVFETQDSDYNYILPVGAVVAVVDLCIAGKISPETVIEWSNFFECRDEVDYFDEERQVITEVLFLLANPEINYPLTVENLKMIRNKCLCL